MAERNAAYFDMSTALGRETYLRARGWESLQASTRSGGLQSPQPVLLNNGAVLFRLFHRTDRRFGEWWATGHELQAVIDHFCVSAAVLAADRDKGRSALHAAFVIRHEWAGRTPADRGAQLRQFIVVRLREPLLAYHGEGDVAPSADHADLIKGQRILDARGRSRGVRQVFLPQPWTYQDAFDPLAERDTGTELNIAVAKYLRGPLYFEA